MSNQGSDTTPNSGKMHREELVLHAALSAPMTARTKEHMRKVLGPETQWNDEWNSRDAPDFNRRIGDTVIGIEHVMVDGLSARINEKPLSLRKIIAHKVKSMQPTQERWSAEECIKLLPELSNMILDPE